MELWLDSTDLKSIRKAKAMGLLYGVTTNPSIIARSGLPLEKALHGLLDIQDGPVTAQVISEKAEGMVEQAKKLHAFSKRIVVKVPVTQEGLKAIHELAHMGIPIMATAIYTPMQVLFASKAGAKYAAMYLSRISDTGVNGLDILAQTLAFLKNFHLPVKLLAASIRTVQQIEECLKLGLSAITIDEKRFDELILDSPFTLERVEAFLNDWQKMPSKSVLF